MPALTRRGFVAVAAAIAAAATVRAPFVHAQKKGGTIACGMNHVSIA